MSNQMQQQVVPLDYNNLGGSGQNNYNMNNNFNNQNVMNGIPRGSYMNQNSNSYDPNFANQTQRINFNQQNNIDNQQNFSNPVNGNYNQNINNNYNQSANQNYMNYNQQNNNIEQNINNGMNDYVKKELSSHGLNLRSPSLSQLRLEEQERKKMLLNNIQSQINLTKKTKLEELRKRQEEDAQYLKDMVVCYPFGRGGGGAPIRDKSGNIVTNRRALISDPKYNLAQINVDDDYYDVWDKEKRIGRFYRNNNSNNQQLGNTGQNFGGMNLNNNQGGYNNQNFDGYEQRPYSTNPRIMNNNNYNNGQMMNNNYPIDNNMNNNYSNNPQFFNTLQRPNTQKISLAYDNYEGMNRDQLRQVKYNYRQDLLNQMKENEYKKLLEKKKKELEEAREEERLRKEREELERKEWEEKQKNQNLENKVRNENNLLILEKNKNNGQNEEFNNLRNVKRVIRTTNIINENTNNIEDQEALDKIHQKEMESKMQLNNEILKLREQMKDQQNDLFNQIQFLKQETQNANQQRVEALKEIEKLKNELSKQRADENIRRKYVYDVIVNDAGNNNIIQETDFPIKGKQDDFIPPRSGIDLTYDKNARNANRIIPVPKVTKINEHGVRTDSKFIDMDTHNIFEGLDIYEPNNKLVDSKEEDFKINSKEMDGDYNILKTSDVLLPNTSDLNQNIVNISLNNKNISSFKNIKNVETNKIGNTENININLESDEDSRLEINRIYNRNIERLRYLNNIENNYGTNNKNKNNIPYEDDFDEFLKKLKRPEIPIPKEEDEFEIEITKLPK